MLYRSLTFPHCSVWEGFGPWARLSATPPRRLSILNLARRAPAII